VASTFFFIAWHREATWTGGGDPQPGLAAFVGGVFVAVLIVGVIVGYVIRRRIIRRHEAETPRHLRPD
jgi:hypothetical protein